MLRIIETVCGWVNEIRESFRVHIRTKIQSYRKYSHNQSHPSYDVLSVREFEIMRSGSAKSNERASHGLHTVM